MYMYTSTVHYTLKIHLFEYSESMEALDVLFSIPTMMKLMVFGFFMALLVGGHRGTDDGLALQGECARTPW